MNTVNEFSLRNKQKYLKVDILHYAFTQRKIFQFLHKTSRGERNFLINEYQIIKNNAKVQSYQGIGLMTINVHGNISKGQRLSCSIGDYADICNRTIHFAYTYTIGYKFPYSSDSIIVSESSSHSFSFVDVKCNLESHIFTVCDII